MNLNSLLMNAYKNGGQGKNQNNDKKDNSDDINLQIKNKSIISGSGVSRDAKNSFVGNEEVIAASKALTTGGLLKVPELPKDSDGRESVYRRVAKFLLLIGVDEAAKILPHLSEEQTEKIIPEIATIQKVEPSEAEEILKEFQSLFYKVRDNGGVDTAKQILEKAFGAEKAKKYLESIENKPLGKPFEYLSEADGERVFLLLKDESNPVRALVLSYLKPKVAAEVIKMLSDGDKKDVIIRLANLSKISPEILKRVDEAMREKMNKFAVQKSDTIDGRSTLAQILKRMDPSTEESLLSTIAEQDSELGADLKNRLFTTEDIINADNRYLQTYLRGMGDNDISFLIAAKDSAFRNKIISNVSYVRGKSILELEEINKPMKRSEIDKITTKFISDMKQAYDVGDLIINGRDGEIYV